MPASGGCILAATHVSSVDPLLLQSCCDRLLHWLIAREWSGLVGARWLFRRIGAVPVNRTGQDVAATRSALRLLHAGKVVAIFPAGDIHQPGSAEPQLKDGAAMLALASRAPLIPARIYGPSHRSVPGDWLGPHRKSSVQFGLPVDLGDLYEHRRDRHAVSEATHRLAEEIRLYGDPARSRACTRPAAARHG